MAGMLHSWQCGICHHVFRTPGRCPRCATSRLGDARGLGEQPSITDRDPGDETIYAVNRAQLAQARIEELQGELDREKSRSQFWHDLCAAHVTQGSRIAALEAENAKLRADLAKWSRSQTVPEGSFW